MTGAYLNIEITFFDMDNALAIFDFQAGLSFLTNSVFNILNVTKYALRSQKTS